ncbi:MAG: hypothetical protein WDM77_10620 [Steroidobacteraceae bacterium]
MGKSLAVPGDLGLEQIEAAQQIVIGSIPVLERTDPKVVDPIYLVSRTLDLPPLGVPIQPIPAGACGPPWRVSGMVFEALAATLQRERSAAAPQEMRQTVSPM